jgi:WhiB family redox-sensing transcriptional regulator
VKRIGTAPAPGQRDSDDWRTRALCRDADPELFHPDGWAGKWLPVIAAARRICNTCPVARTCLATALAAERGLSAYSRDGIYAGTTPSERHRMHKEGRAA